VGVSEGPVEIDVDVSEDPAEVDVGVSEGPIEEDVGVSEGHVEEDVGGKLRKMWGWRLSFKRVCMNLMGMTLM